MYLEDFLSATHIWRRNCNLSIETSRSQNCRIKNIHTVGGCHHDNAFVDAETVHLYQHLVQGLLTFIVATAHTGSTASCHCINLIDKDNTGSMPFRICKQITDTGCTHTHKHFHKIRTGNTEERHIRLSCHCFCQQGLTGSGRALQQNALGDSCTYLRELCRIFQKVHDFFQFFLFFFQTGHILKGHMMVSHGKLGTALAEVHHLAAVSSGSILIIDHDKDENTYNHHQENGQYII